MQDRYILSADNLGEISRESANRAQGVLQGVAFRGVQVLREKRLISLHEKRVWRTAKMK